MKVHLPAESAFLLNRSSDLPNTGPIILQKAVEVQEGDTPEILQRRVMEQAEWKIMPQAIDLIANGKVTVTGKTVHISK